MAMLRLTIGVLSALTLMLGSAGLGHAQTKNSGRLRLELSPAEFRTPLSLPPSLFRNAKVYTYQQILAQTLAEKSPDAAEVHTYLSSPAKWQKDASKNKWYELGLPQSRVILADRSIIRTWLRPQLPQDWRYHRFTHAPPKNFVMLTFFDPTHLIEVQTFPGSKVWQLLQGRLPKGKGT